MKTPLLAALAACALLGACAHPSLNSRADDEAVLHGEGEQVSFRVTPEGYTGPTVQVARTGDELRGRAEGRSVELDVSGDHIRGLVGGSPVELRLNRLGDGLRVSGLYRGELSDLRVTSDRVEGRIGRCSYDLTSAQDASYQGQASCGGSPVQTRLVVPRALLAKPLSERAAAVALLLG